MKARFFHCGQLFARLHLWPIILGCGLAVAPGDTASPQGSGPEVFNCVINPARMVRLSSEVNGILSDVLVSRGDVVKQGDVVAKLRANVEEVSAEISRTRAESTAEIDAQIARNDFSRKEFERTQQLVSKDVATTQRLDALSADLEVGVQQLARLNLQHRLERLDAEKADRMLQQRVLRSPIDGIVHERLLDEGEFVSDGYESYVLVIAQLDPLFVEAHLPVEMFGRLKIGQPGEVTMSGAVAGSFQAEVTVIDRVFDIAKQTFGVRLVLPNPDHRLPAGQVCRVSF